jgi:arsenate reductase
MAEGFAKQFFGPDWRIASAGVETHGLNPRAVAAMAEVGVDISKQYSKLIDDTYLQSADIVVTLCGDARDKCPVTPPSVTRLHWPLPDPAAVSGTDTVVMNAFRSVRDEIKRRVQDLAAETEVE